MKAFLVFTLCFFAVALLNAQNQGISYQAVIIDQNPQEVPGVDIEGNILPNQPLMVRFTILDAAGTINYQEEHTTTTDAFGMINLIISRGEVTSASPNTFIEIDWDGSPKDLKVDISLGNEDVFYMDFSYQELNFVPYAYHKNITATGTMSIDGMTTLKSRLDVTNQSPVFLTGDLTVEKTSTLNSQLTVNAASQLKGQVTIEANVDGDKTKYESYPLRVQGSNQGIAIKVDGSRNSDNNFITFMDAENIQGRIEGQTTGELLSDPEYIFDNVLFANSLIVASVDVAKAVVGVVSASTSSTVCVGLGACVTAPTPSLIIGAAAQLVMDIANLALSIAEPIIYNVSVHSNIGITYQSGAGDYAEWLPKQIVTETFESGDIVGVKGGYISHSTANAELILVISHNPIVLGNMPQQGKESNYEKIAFMGQVPVKVFGTVKPGDYILASGNNDGYGIARSPEKMELKDCQRIVGTAWSGSDTPVNFVNVAVGMHGNSISKLSLQQEQTIQKQQTDIEKLTKQLNAMNQVLAQLVPEYASQMQFTNDEANQNETPENTTDKSGVGKTIVYHAITTDYLEQGIDLAEQIMKERGIDLTNHPFFSKLYSDPDFKQKTIDEMNSYIQDERTKRFQNDLQTGANVIME